MRRENRPAPHDASKGASIDRADGAVLLGLTVLWCAMVPWLGLHGEFPLNDDWAYAWSVERLIETGTFARHQWTWTPVYTNIAIGAIFATLFGFSDVTLRASGLVFGWLAILGIYLLCRRAGAGRAGGILGALVFGWSPFHVNLSYTFMTDVPFTALCVWSLLLLHHGLERRSWGTLAGGFACGALATLSRQPGIALPVSALIVLALRHRRRRKRLALGLAVVSVLVALVLVVPALVYERGKSHPYTLLKFIERALENPYSGFFLSMNGLTSLTYLGLLLAPLAVLMPGPRRWPWTWGISVALTLAILGGVAASRYRMPLGVNMAHGHGLGPITLAGAEQLPGLGAGGWWVLLGGGVLFGALITARLLRELRDRRGAILDDPAWLLLVIFPALYLVPLLLRMPFFDRYFLPILAPLTAVLLGQRKPAGVAPLARWVAGGLLLLLAGYAVLGTRDYLEHHRQRQVLLDDLLAKGIHPERINGGFEFAGRHNFGKAPPVEPYGWVVDDEYLVTYADAVDGYERIAAREYDRLLPPYTERVYVHRRKP